MPLCSSLTAASANVKNALQIGKACMDGYENKLPQGFYSKISSYVVIRDAPMKGSNTGAVTTVDIGVVFTEHFALSVQKSLICMICSPMSWHQFGHHCS